MASIPRLGGGQRRERLKTIPGQVPMLSRLPPGCRFSTRCAHAEPRCSETAPSLTLAGEGRQVRCLRWAELDLAERAPA